MEKYDPEMAKRVWQRVKGEVQPPEVPGPSVQSLAAAELEQAGRLLQLSGQLQGRWSMQLRRLYEAEKKHADILRGIGVLTAGKCPPVRLPQAKQSAPEIVLRKCYGAALRAMKEYENRIADPEYGPAFAELARQEQSHCAALLEILGGLQG